MEFATVYAELGCKVTILEALPRILPNMDKEISQNLKLILKKRGIDIHTAAAVQGVEADGDQYICKYVEKEKRAECSLPVCIMCGWKMPEHRWTLCRRCDTGDEPWTCRCKWKFETKYSGRVCNGDLIFGAQLAHAASAQGIQVAEQLAGKSVCRCKCSSRLCIHRS